MFLQDCPKSFDVGRLESDALGTRTHHEHSDRPPVANRLSGKTNKILTALRCHNLDGVELEVFLLAWSTINHGPSFVHPLLAQKALPDSESLT